MGTSRRQLVTLAGQTRTVEIEALDGERAAGGRPIRAVVDGRALELDVRSIGPGRYTWLEGPRVVTAEVEGGERKADGAAARVTVAVGTEVLVGEVADAQAVTLAQVAGRAAGRTAGPTAIRSPMPGRVVKVLAKVGDEVKAGRGLLVVEAMKMENEIRAPRDGRVKELRASEGQAVEAGHDLVVIE
jgi:biotin carboxyl carrier protein